MEEMNSSYNRAGEPEEGGWDVYQGSDCDCDEYDVPDSWTVVSTAEDGESVVAGP